MPIEKLPLGDCAVLLQFTRDSRRLIVCTVQYKVVIFHLTHATAGGHASATLFKTVNALSGHIDSSSSDDDAGSESSDSDDDDSGAHQLLLCPNH